LNHNLLSLKTGFNRILGLKNLIKLLQGAAFGLWESEEDCYKDNDINRDENYVKFPSQSSNSRGTRVEVYERGDTDEQTENGLNK
jgi:hypothetical protein